MNCPEQNFKITSGEQLKHRIIVNEICEFTVDYRNFRWFSTFVGPVVLSMKINNYLKIYAVHLLTVAGLNQVN